MVLRDAEIKFQYLIIGLVVISLLGQGGPRRIFIFRVGKGVKRISAIDLGEALGKSEFLIYSLFV